MSVLRKLNSALPPSAFQSYKAAIDRLGDTGRLAAAAGLTGTAAAAPGCPTMNTCLAPRRTSVLAAADFSSPASH